MDPLVGTNLVSSDPGDSVSAARSSRSDTGYLTERESGLEAETDTEKTSTCLRPAIHRVRIAINEAISRVAPALNPRVELHP